MAGFSFRYRLSGGAPTIEDLTFKDTETLTKGDMANLETGEVDLAASEDANLLGVCLETVVGTDSTTKIQVITDADAVYAVSDESARVKGATLDIAGTTGEQKIATSSKKEFVVVAASSATEPTLVRFNVGKHHNNVAQ
ncbi:MAG: hypothetical protein Q8R92_05395 [Deltaproteobacteria bacterium]|nr:hypothetical protein [Deltaproteobacteria bacterium]